MTKIGIKMYARRGELVISFSVLLTFDPVSIMKN